MSAETPLTLEAAIERFLAERAAGSDEPLTAFAARFPHMERELRDALEVLALLDSASAKQPRFDEELPGRIANFRIVREVGRGGMGVVLEAVEEPLERRVALKVLPAELVRSASARARFQREAELAARLEHSGIATIFGAGVDVDRPWIAMRFVEGRTLASFIAQARAEGASSIALSDAEPGSAAAVTSIARCLAAVARALHFAHEHGVVHRDVKPSNIVVSSDGAPTLLDFGLAIHEDTSGQTLTRTGETAGTPAYFAPEIVNAELRRPDAQSDVYALGVSLYECLTTQRPFDAPTPIALYRAIGSGVATDPRALNPAIPRDLAVVVTTAMERDRGRRYASAARLADDLEAILAGRPIAARPIPLAGRIARWARREPRQAALAGLLCVAALGLATFAGNWWVSRGVVQAAEQVARTTAREEALTRGFVALQGSDRALTELEFEHALELDPLCVEARAGLALMELGRNRTAAALQRLETLPRTRGFEALRALCRKEDIGQDQGALSDPALTSEDFFLVGAALQIEILTLPRSRAPATARRALAMLDEAVLRTRSPRLFHHILRAYAARFAHDEAAARSAAGALVSLFPDDFHAVCEAGVVLSVFDPQAAVPLLERATLMDRTNPAAFQNLALTYQALGRLEDSERAAWLASRVSDDPECFNTLGVSLMMRECPEEGGRAFERAFAADSAHYFTIRNLAFHRLGSGDSDTALLLLEKLLQRDPFDADVHGYMAGVLDQAGRADDGLVHFLTAIALDPENGEMWAAYFHRLRQQGDMVAARAVLDAGLGYAPTDPRLLDIQKRLSGRR